jgi:hypothetical protein
MPDRWVVPEAAVERWTPRRRSPRRILHVTGRLRSRGVRGSDIVREPFMELMDAGKWTDDSHDRVR